MIEDLEWRTNEKKELELWACDDHGRWFIVPETIYEDHKDNHDR